jgi:hypothetical protein
MTHEATSQRQPAVDPEQMRRAVADYVRAVHESYLRRAQLFTPAVQGRLALLEAGRFSVAAVGARHLHLIGTPDPLGDAAGSAATVTGEARPLWWTVAFYDPVIVPALGTLNEADAPAFDGVKRLIGIRRSLYHLTVRPPAELGEHHASHVGLGLVNAHAAQVESFQAVRRARPEQEALVDELEAAAHADLRQAQALLAQAIAPGDARLDALAREPRPDPAAVRSALLDAVGAHGAGRVS